MKANLANREPQMLNTWETSGLYHKIRSWSAGKQKFILHDGPPYANGDIHIGHAVNKILKDIIVKSKSLSNFDAPYIPGWDCHGLPIELQVEKKTGKPGLDIDAKAFRKACRQYAQRRHYVGDADATAEQDWTPRSHVFRHALFESGNGRGF